MFAIERAVSHHFRAQVQSIVRCIRFVKEQNGGRYIVKDAVLLGESAGFFDISFDVPEIRSAMHSHGAHISRRVLVAVNFSKLKGAQLLVVSTHSRFTDACFAKQSNRNPGTETHVHS